MQTCVIHLLRNTFRYASRKYWDQIAKDIRPVYTAPTEAAAKERFVEFTAKWGHAVSGDHPALGERLERVRAVPGLSTSRSAGSSARTNAIESINARYRRAVQARGHFPTEQAALKCLYLVTRSPRPHRPR